MEYLGEAVCEEFRLTTFIQMSLFFSVELQI
jgi:hypothetical protein